MIAIIGAGLTGLSTARYLKKKPYCVFEQQEEAGGLCRSACIDGFTFEYTGHLLHVKDPSLGRFLQKLLPGKLEKISRNAAIYCRGRYLPYPFQANLHGLPREVVSECLAGFLEAYGKPQQRRAPANFRDWVFDRFGAGIAKYFFIPYNEKLWQRDLRKLTAEWASWSVPQPSLQEVVQGAFGIQNTGMGYNASFYYPRAGGIQALPDALAGQVKNLHFKKRLASVHLSKKIIAFDDGTEAPYDSLVSTLPLPELLMRIQDLPAEYKRCAPRLSFVTVQNLNIGVNRQKISPCHWIYFPEAAFPFYRVGFYSNFTPYMAPKKASSMYVEISTAPENKKSPKQALDASVEGLRGCGILKRGDRIVAHNYNEITSAYVVFDEFRRKNLPRILRYLKKRGVISAGRYGSWTYSSMEDSLVEGKEIARSLL